LINFNSNSLDKFCGGRVKVGVVGGNACSAIFFNTQVVGVHLHAEETSLSPVGAPGVTANPVLFTGVGLTVTDYTDLVVDEDVI